MAVSGIDSSSSGSSGGASAAEGEAFQQNMDAQNQQGVEAEETEKMQSSLAKKCAEDITTA